MWQHVNNMHKIVIKFLLQDKKWERLQNQQKYILQQKNVVAGKNLPYDSGQFFPHDFSLLVKYWSWNRFCMTFVILFMTTNQSYRQNIIVILGSEGVNKNRWVKGRGTQFGKTLKCRLFWGLRTPFDLRKKSNETLWPLQKQY